MKYRACCVAIETSIVELEVFISVETATFKGASFLDWAKPGKCASHSFSPALPFPFVATCDRHSAQIRMGA